jgi:hypothetical protein
MAIINVRRGPRGPLANYVQAVRNGMGMRGLGQADTYDPDSDSFIPTVSTPITSPVSTPIFGDLSGGVSSSIFSLEGGSSPSTGSPATASNSSGSFNLSQLLSGLTGDAASAAKIYQSLQTPSLIPGTNAIYNAATGQYYNPTTGQVVNPSGISTLGVPTDISAALPQLLLFGGLAVGAMVILSALGKH